MSDSNDPMAEIRASFFIECEELLEAAQEGLQSMEDGSADPDTINSVFRAVHSIKGGAGAFGLDDLVKFAHSFETVLDEVRSGNYHPDHDAILLFFSCGDILSDLVRAARDETPVDEEAISRTLAALQAIAGEEEEEISAEEFQPTGLSISLDLPDLDEEESATSARPGYRIVFKPDEKLYALGNEPLYVLRALGQLGDVATTLHHDDVPDLDELGTKATHLWWELTLQSEANRPEVEEVFEFVEGLCELEISEVTLEDGVAAGDLPPMPDFSALNADDDTAEETPAQAAPPPSFNAGDEKAEAQDAPAASAERNVPVKAAAKPASAASANAAANATVRVDLERIDRLVNLVGELVINQAMLSQSVTEAGLPPNSPVVNGLEEFMQLTRDIQDSVMMIRAQPVKSLFQRMSRIVRESSAAIGKTVRLKTDGETTEVDKTVIERLADPLTHMIRNAVDHGLEKTETRLASGKPPEGLVTLSAGHRSGRVVIEVSDDGGGINREKVLSVAIKKGLVPEDSSLTDSEIDNLLFLPGFSTASEVSSLSGRGVGMDVVKSSIQGLGGRIAINSEQGKGTTFSISLPLTLAVLDGMVVHVANETLVVPLNAIVETLTLTEGDIRALGPETNVVQIRGEFVPLLDLGTELGYREPLENYCGGIILLIAHEDGSRAALVVDSIHDQRQVVIKGLQDSYGHVPGVAAATILGDGQIALILDPIDITANASGRTCPKNTSLLEVG
ncbi:chemotaxis protein CheA [Mangrovicoccus algicola]|uniref:Chemotaxis protein CheA n=1 Tax=Mangrovicoccus algicola TaxID=2771008 RepID=A0A8J6ZAE0_9RHOB|nr:chemotaxis protein CheA [Mangrovicoccus algicola]MBE3639086.1 chemotaxis protein CheA [Mangrovicoccus algicola]